MKNCMGGDRGVPIPGIPGKKSGNFRDSRRSRKLSRELMKFPAFPDDNLNRRRRLFSTDQDVGYIAALCKAPLVTD